MKKPEVIIIGAGPGGLSAANALVKTGLVNVMLIQREGVAQFLPGILPTLLGRQSVSMYRYDIVHSQVRVFPGEVVSLEAGRVHLADGTVLSADAIIAAPGLAIDATAIPVGPQSFPVWELDTATQAQQAIVSLTSGRLVVAIASLPYRCPPAPYGLAISLKALFQERRQAIDVVLVTPEERPLQALGPRVSEFLETLTSTGHVTVETAFQFDNTMSQDGTLVALDGRRLSYDVGLFVPPHRRPALLKDVPGKGAMVQVDEQQRTGIERTWVVGDVAGTALPRAAGVAEAQGRTAAASVLTTLGLAEAQHPIIPSPNCYIWTGQERAGQIQLRFPRGLPPVGKPDILIEQPTSTIFEEALNAREQWLKQMQLL
ncbi:MAG: FAD/NAD(P)-binding oxidoreductase [Ktedonobacteraceae bacterium]